MYTKDRKVKDKFGCGDLENLDTVTKTIWGLGIVKVNLDTKYFAIIASTQQHRSGFHGWTPHTKRFSENHFGQEGYRL